MPEPLQIFFDSGKCRWLSSPERRVYRNHPVQENEVVSIRPPLRFGLLNHRPLQFSCEEKSNMETLYS